MRRWVVVAIVIAALAGVAGPALAGTLIVDGLVETIEIPFVDDSRSRELVTTITYPTALEEPAPLVVLAHGNSGHPSNFVQLMEAWAGAGYVVAAPAFPAGSEGNPGELRDQVEDMSFVIDEVLKLNGDETSPIFERVDKQHIGAAGLSLGGGTVYGLVFNACCRDKRIDAVVLMSTLRITLTGSKEKFPHLPAMMIAGDADPISRVTVNTYPLLSTPKWMVMLRGGTHSDPFEDTPDPADEVVRQITTAFWDRYLRSDKPAAQRIRDAVSEYCNAELEVALGSGSSASECSGEVSPGE
ncbi:MAG: alpha/beta fold hydrolase [Acidimicrobiia bacterium]